MGGADKGDDIRQGRKILMQPTALDRIQLTFPASDSAMLVLRMTTVGVLAQVGLALDVVDGIKLAVDEAARQFVTCAREKQLSASFAQAEDGLHIIIGVADGTAIAPDPEEWMVLLCVLESMVCTVNVLGAEDAPHALELICRG